MGYLWILLAVSLLVSAVGWKYYVYFFSIGYGFGIAALALVIALLFGLHLTPATTAMCLVLILYGCRLGGYLLIREKKSAAYRKILFDPLVQEKKPVKVIIAIWVACSLLYVGEVSPVAFRLANAAPDNVWAWIGLAMMVLGFALEAIADAQKTAAKKVNPKRFVDTGLYRIVRCPNYLGEVVLWTGCFISAIGAGLNGWQWLIAALGYIGILFVMFSGARRLELRQIKTYGEDEEFQKYSSKTPILLPLVPIYSLAKYKWLVA